MPVDLKTVLTLGAMLGFAVVLAACGERQSTQSTHQGASAAAGTSTEKSETPVAPALVEIATPAAGQGASAKSGQIAEFGLPSLGSAPSGIAAGPDGNLWFTENFRGRIGRVTPSRQITLFNIPTRPGGGSSNPLSIAAGPDGNLWFTKDDGMGEAKVAKITPTGVVTEYALPIKNPQPMTIASGPDGNLWLTETNNPANKVARITPTGSVTEFQVPTGFSGPYGIVAGPDGNLWFTERGKGRIERLHAAADDVRYVLHLASAFVPGSTTVALGQAVEWINQMPGVSSVRQASTPPIFDSSTKGTGSTYAIRFPVAGTYAYLDHAHASHTGTVMVPMAVSPASGAQTTQFVLTWASGVDPVVPNGWLIDVQVAAPQAADFAPWRSGVTTKAAAYVSTAGPGVYRFRARLRHASVPSASDWSPVVPVTVR